MKLVELDVGDEIRLQGVRYWPTDAGLRWCSLL